MSQQELTPFALYLQDYMWSQRPPLNRTTLAQRVGLPKQSVNIWFVNRSVPRPMTVILLAKRLGLPVRELLSAAGYDADRYLSDAALLTSEDRSVADEVFDYIRQDIEQATDLRPTERSKVVRRLEELRERYEADRGDADDPKVRLAR